LGPETQADGLGWDGVAPLALGLAGTFETFPARITIPPGVEPVHAIARATRVRHPLLWDIQAKTTKNLIALQWS